MNHIILFLNRYEKGLKMQLLSRSEEIVLLAIWKLRDEAYGITIREQVIKMTGNPWTIGAIYAPLHRLEKKGYVKTRKGAPVKERGGRHKIYYEITPLAKDTLFRTREIQNSAWAEIQALESEKA